MRVMTMFRALQAGLDKLRKCISITDHLLSPSAYTFAAHPSWTEIPLDLLLADWESMSEACVLSASLRLVERSAYMKAAAGGSSRC